MTHGVAEINAAVSQPVYPCWFGRGYDTTVYSMHTQKQRTTRDTHGVKRCHARGGTLCDAYKLLYSTTSLCSPCAPERCTITRVTALLYCCRMQGVPTLLITALTVHLSIQQGVVRASLLRPLVCRFRRA